MITGSEEESRALMMNAAVRIVAKYGFEGFTTKKWAAEAGVAEGSLYYHFKGKHDLLNETFFMIDREVAALYTEEDIFPEDREERMRFVEELWSRYYAYLLNNPEKTLYYYRFRTSPRYTDGLQKEQLSVYNWFLSMLAMIRSSLELDEHFARHVVWCYVLDATTALAFRVITGGVQHTEETQRQIVRLMMQGLIGVMEEKQQ